jgi:hypothetical protein
MDNNETNYGPTARSNCWVKTDPTTLNNPRDHYDNTCHSDLSDLVTSSITRVIQMGVISKQRWLTGYIKHAICANSFISYTCCSFQFPKSWLHSVMSTCGHAYKEGRDSFLTKYLMKGYLFLVHIINKTIRSGYTQHIIKLSEFKVQK